MKKFLRVMYAEIIKQHRTLFHSRIVCFSLLIWPILEFVQVYYAFKPFNLGNNQTILTINSRQSLLIFLITGFLGFTCFWSMVQSAWQMAFERSNGTLEIIFLSPANRLAVIYGRALGSLIANIWMFSLFSLFILLTNRTISLNTLFYLPIAFLILVISATIWGGLMNAIFMFSRDATFLYYIFNAPMELFSGVRIPISVFPFWAKLISTIFPLTYCLVLIRSILSPNGVMIDMVIIYKLGISLTAILMITIISLKIAEKHSRKTGDLNFY